jgi:hypothetical protein
MLVGCVISPMLQQDTPVHETVQVAGSSPTIVDAARRYLATL